MKRMSDVFKLPVYGYGVEGMRPILNVEAAHAINCHDDLVEALEAFVNFKSDGTTSVNDDDQLWLKAEQALAKARGE